MSSASGLLPTVQACLAGSDLDAMSVDALRARFEETVAAEKWLAGYRVALMKQLDDKAVWIGTGARSTVDYVARVTGQSMGRSAGEVEASRRLAELPQVRQAVEAGQLSPDQIQVVTDGAAADPSAQTELLHQATEGTFKGLRDLGTKVRLAATPEEVREKRIRRERSVRHGISRDGAYELHLRTTAAIGVLLSAELRPYEEAIFREARAAGVTERPTFENRLHDAFVERFFDGPPCDLDDNTTGADIADESGETNRPDESGGDDRTRSSVRSSVSIPDPVPRRKKRRRLPGGNNVKTIVRVDARPVLAGRTEIGDTVEVPGIGPISVPAFKELMATANPFLAIALTDGVDVYNVTHVGRDPTAHQRTALEALSIQCSNIECNGSVGIEIDHREEVKDGGKTHVCNLDPLCPICHKLKTHRGWRLEEGDGRRRFLPPGATGPPGASSSGRVAPAVGSTPRAVGSPGRATDQS